MSKDINMGSEKTISNSGHFSDYEFLPAVIVETDDPLHYGRIKVTALGAYNANKSPITHLPWCYPFTMMGNASYASYEKGSKVWVIRNKKRQDENWFIPMYELHSLPQQYVNENADKKAEVISMRNNGGGSSSMTYDHGKGYNISTSGGAGGAAVNVGTGGQATVSGGSSAVKVDNSGVTIGASSGGGEPAVLGNKLKDLINAILEALSIFCDTLQKTDPYAQAGVLSLMTFIETLKAENGVEEILSKTVTINDGESSSEASGESEGSGEGGSGESSGSSGGSILDAPQNTLNKVLNGDTSGVSTTSKFFNDMIQKTKSLLPNVPSANGARPPMQIKENETPEHAWMRTTSIAKPSGTYQLSQQSQDYLKQLGKQYEADRQRAAAAARERDRIQTGQTMVSDQTANRSNIPNNTLEQPMSVPPSNPNNPVYRQKY